MHEKKLNKILRCYQKLIVLSRKRGHKTMYKRNLHLISTVISQFIVLFCHISTCDMEVNMFLNFADCISWKSHF